MEFNDMEALVVEEKRLWAILQERTKAKDAANQEWFAAHRKVMDAREQQRIDGLVESRLREKEQENGKQQKGKPDRPRPGVLSRVLGGRR